MKQKHSIVAEKQSSSTRRESLLQAASELFFEQGYTATSLDAIIRRAGGSKRAIYTEFGGKKELFLALLKEIGQQNLAVLEGQHGQHSDLRSALNDFAQQTMSALMSPSALGLARSIMTEGLRFPELGDTYFRFGPGKMVRLLTDIFAAAIERGEIVHSRPEVLASLFLGMLRNTYYFQVVFRMSPVPEAEFLRNEVLGAVDIFLYGVLHEPKNRRISQNNHAE